MQDQKYYRIWRVNFDNICFLVITIILITSLHGLPAYRSAKPSRRYQLTG